MVKSSKNILFKIILQNFDSQITETYFTDTTKRTAWAVESIFPQHIFLSFWDPIFTITSKIPVWPRNLKKFSIFNEILSKIWLFLHPFSLGPR
jgi:hypothetical protein